MTFAEVESAVRAAAAAWNSGCRIRFEYTGTCAGGQGAYRVTWISFDPNLQFEGKSIRQHAVAAANPGQRLVGLNRDVGSAEFQSRWRRSIMHEFGHLAGIGHSQNPDDLMYSGGASRESPNANDFAACNQAAATR